MSQRVLSVISIPHPFCSDLVLQNLLKDQQTATSQQHIFESNSHCCLAKKGWDLHFWASVSFSGKSQNVGGSSSLPRPRLGRASNCCPRRSKARDQWSAWKRPRWNPRHFVRLKKKDVCFCRRKLCFFVHPGSLTACPWKMVLGRLLSFWEGSFSGAISFGEGTQKKRWRDDKLLIHSFTSTVS